VIETVVANTFQESLADRIGIRHGNRRFEDFDACSSRYTGELPTNLAVVVSDEILRLLIKW